MLSLCQLWENMHTLQGPLWETTGGYQPWSDSFCVSLLQSGLQPELEQSLGSYSFPASLPQLTSLGLALLQKWVRGLCACAVRGLELESLS